MFSYIKTSIIIKLLFYFPIELYLILKLNKIIICKTFPFILGKENRRDFTKSKQRIPE